MSEQKTNRVLPCCGASCTSGAPPCSHVTSGAGSAVPASPQLYTARCRSSVSQNRMSPAVQKRGRSADGN